MEFTQFDALTQSLAKRHSRRGITRLLGGLALGGTLALLGTGPKPRPRAKSTAGHVGSARRASASPRRPARRALGAPGSPASRPSLCHRPHRPYHPHRPAATASATAARRTWIVVAPALAAPTSRVAPVGTTAGGALCQGDVCRVCDPAVANHCGQDAVGPCSCQLRNDGQRFCAQGSFLNQDTCALCPSGTQCVDMGASVFEIRCFTLCGAPV